MSLLLSLLSSAHAFDAHGVALVPSGEGSTMTWTPSAGVEGPQIGLDLEYVEKALLLNPAGPDVTTIVDDLVVLDLSASWHPHRRLGVAIDVPFYAMGATDLKQGGASLGDVRLWAPVALLPQREQGLGLALVPGVALPVGDEDRALGEAGLQGSALLAAGWHQGRWQLAANVGVAGTRTSEEARRLDQAFRRRLLLGASAGVDLTERWLLTGELNARVAGETDGVAALPAEATLGLAWDMTESLTLRGAVATGLTAGAGAPRARLLVGVSWRPAAGPKDTVPVTPVLPVVQAEPVRVQLVDTEGHPVVGAALSGPELQAVSDSEGFAPVYGLAPGIHTVQVEAEGFLASTVPVLVLEEGGGVQEFVLERPPGALEVRAHDTEGRPLDARVRFEGPKERAQGTLGADGVEALSLTDGLWTVWVEADGYGSQARRVEVDTTRKVLQVADFVLLPKAGDAELTLLVIDPDGLSVDGVALELDGISIGGSSSGGALVIQGLKAGPHAVEGSGDTFREQPPLAFTLLSGGQEEVLMMKWLPGSVRIITRDLHGDPLDALVAFSGPEDISPQGVGPDGERFYSLDPGEWTVMVSSSSFGVQQRDVVVLPNETSLLAISAFLREAEGNAALALTVVDEDGDPVRGAAVALDGEPLGTTSTGGSIWVGGLAEGALTVEATGSVYDYVVVDVDILDVTDRTVVLPYRSGTIEVRALTASGEPTDALVRASGVFMMPPMTLGDDGRRMIFLEPGDWVVAASSAQLGVVERDVLVLAGQQARVDLPFQETGETPAVLVDVAAEEVKLWAPVEFETGSAELLPSSIGILSALAGILLETPSIAKVEVQGHTDSQGGSAENLALSQERAEAVKAWLVEAGVDEQRLEAKGYGEEVAVASNDTPTGRARNRRVEVHILEKVE